MGGLHKNKEYKKKQDTIFWLQSFYQIKGTSVFLFVNHNVWSIIRNEIPYNIALASKSSIDCEILHTNDPHCRYQKKVDYFHLYQIKKLVLLLKYFFSHIFLRYMSTAFFFFSHDISLQNWIMKIECVNCFPH